MTHRPFLQITLSPKPLGLELGEEGRSVTCQYIMIKRRKGEVESSSEDEGGERGQDGEAQQEQSTTPMAIDGDDGEDLGVAVDRRTLMPPSKAVVRDGQKRKSPSETVAGAKRSKKGTNGTSGKTDEKAKGTSAGGAGGDARK